MRRRCANVEGLSDVSAFKNSKTMKIPVPRCTLSSFGSSVGRSERCPGTDFVYNWQSAFSRFYDVVGAVQSFIAFMLSGLQIIKAHTCALLWIGVHLLLFYPLLCLGVD